MAMTADAATDEPPAGPGSGRPGPTDQPVVSRVNRGAAAHLELLDDDYARPLLEALSDGPKRGRELLAACEGSRSTVYRRLDRLAEAGFVTSELTLDPDGHHCKVFRLARDTVTVTVENGGLTVTAQPS